MYSIQVYLPLHPLHISSKCWWYLEADHGEVGPHHRVKVVENVGFTQRILRLCQVTQLHRGGREGEEIYSYNIQQNYIHTSVTYCTYVSSQYNNYINYCKYIVQLILQCFLLATL